MLVIFGRSLKELRGVKILFWRVPQEAGRAWHYFVLVWHGSLRNMVSTYMTFNIDFFKNVIVVVMMHGSLAEPNVIHVTITDEFFFVYFQTEKNEKLEREENGENMKNFFLENARNNDKEFL